MGKGAKLLRISRSPLYRRLEDHGVSADDYSDLSSQELDQIVENLKCDHPNSGEVLLRGHLSQLGIKVPHSQLKASIHQLDHES